jgi:hypothetical protein
MAYIYRLYDAQSIGLLLRLTLQEQTLSPLSAILGWRQTLKGITLKVSFLFYNKNNLQQADFCFYVFYNRHCISYNLDVRMTK